MRISLKIRMAPSRRHSNSRNLFEYLKIYAQLPKLPRLEAAAQIDVSVALH